MKIRIKVDSEVSKKKRGVYLNDKPSHHFAEDELQGFLKKARLSSWRINVKDGVELGKGLYGLLNGSAGQLNSLIEKSYAQGDPLYLYFDIPFELDALPVELLHNKQFLLLKSDTHIIRQVTERNRLQRASPQKRALKMLFIACSPLDLAGAVLQFEKEEETILKEMEKFQVEITVEDSGSLEGLQNALIEADGFDIVHMTGHAGIAGKSGPVFYMENEIGEPDKVTPDRLAGVLRDYLPDLLFLSGCSTGKSDKVNEAESFAHQLVEAGVPVVLGWGLPVSDVGATLFTAELYKYLAQGKPVDFSAQRARQFVEKSYHPWPLLRLFTDGSPLSPLIAPGQPVKQKTKRAVKYKFLQQSQVKVLEYGFVGRRREIQKGIQVLKGYSDKYGLLIRGPAGVGKSCLAGKLIERSKDKELVVFHGELKKADILQKFRTLFDKKGLAHGVQALQAEAEYEDRIKELFRTVFKELPTIVYFDDFEQNLERHGDDYRLGAEFIEAIKPFLTALEWTEGKTNLLITSRYPFVMEIEGKDLGRETLEDITLMSFKGGDLEKKKIELEHIAKSQHSDLYIEFGKGNPRLLEWLEKIAQEEDKYNIKELKKALQGKNEEFIRQYLAEVMAKTEGKAFRKFFSQAAVFRLPVEQSAFETFGNAKLLGKGVDLTLFEREQSGGQPPVYWVTPVIRENEWHKLSVAEKAKMHRRAYSWYDKEIADNETPNYLYMEEAVYHAMDAGDIRGACKHAIPLAKYLHDILLYRDRMLLLQNVADKLNDRIIQEVVKEKDENVPTLLNNLGFAWKTLGEAKKAIEFYDKALEIDLNALGEKHPDVAIDYNNLGGAWHALGDAKKAIEFYEKALEIFTAVYGSDHPNTQMTQANLNAMKGK